MPRPTRRPVRILALLALLGGLVLGAASPATAHHAPAAQHRVSADGSSTGSSSSGSTGSSGAAAPSDWWF